jgi:hypothetical protein
LGSDGIIDAAHQADGIAAECDRAEVTQLPARELHARKLAVPLPCGAITVEDAIPEEIVKKLVRPLALDHKIWNNLLMYYEMAAR